MTVYLENTLLICTTDPERQGKVVCSCPYTGDTLFVEHRQRVRQGKTSLSVCRIRPDGLEKVG